MERYRNNPWLIFLMIILIIVTITAITSPNSFSNILKSSPSARDVILNPQNYVNQSINLKSVLIIETPLSGAQIIEKAEDGTPISLTLNWGTRIYPTCRWFDIEGYIKKSASTYYFDATRVICVKESTNHWSKTSGM